jgi:hypothetical protein
MSLVFDQGLALFAGLNAIPKRTFLTEYSSRLAPTCYPKLMRAWFDACAKLGLDHGHSFDLDFHTIPSHGEDVLLEKHYVSKRSRRQKGILAFLAEDAETRVFCYGNAAVRKDEQTDEVLRFVEYWHKRTGRLPEEVVFDSRLGDLCQFESAQHARDQLHYAAPAQPKEARCHRKRAALGVATHRARGCRARLQKTTDH